jgi:murein DD-endopeptidase MepM/ murein hydrolase activator NlpD
MIIRLILLLLLLNPTPVYELALFKIKATKVVKKEFQFPAPIKGNIMSPFGRRGGRMHTGVDIAACRGVPIKAVSGGVVKKAGYFGK